jgi:hypothetical protein
MRAVETDAWREGLMRRIVSSLFANSGFPPVRRWLRQPPCYPGHLQWRRRVQSAGVVSGALLLALAVSEPAAHAQRVNFTYTGKLVTWTVPKTGTYQIIAYGAQGGSISGATILGPYMSAGGRGAEIGGNFALTAGEALQIAVGGAGISEYHGGSGSGGGGSFVVGPDNTPLVIAGGGGGGGAGASPDSTGNFGIPGGDGLTGPGGTSGLTDPGGTGYGGRGGGGSGGG